MKKFTISSLLALVLILVLATAALADTDSLPGSGWWSGQVVQNVSSNTATVALTAYDSATTNTYSLTGETILSGESKGYHPFSIPGLPAGFQGSMIVSSSEDARAMVSVTNRYLTISGNPVGDPLSVSPATASYQGVVTPGSPLYFPLAKNNHFGKSTSFAVQNAGGSAATFTASFRLPNAAVEGAPKATYTYTSPTLQPGQMAIFGPWDATPTPPVGDWVIGSLTVTSGQALAGSYMEYKTGETHPTALQASSAFSPADLDDIVYVPGIKSEFYNRITGLQIQNTSGGILASLTVTYKGAISHGTVDCVGITYTDTFFNLPDKESVTFVHATALGSALPAGCFATATITASGNIVALVAESFHWAYVHPAGAGINEFTTHNAMPENSATRYISLPNHKEYAYSKQHGASLYNPSTTTTANVILTFKGPTGTYVSNSFTIAPLDTFLILEMIQKDASFWNGTAMNAAALGCSPDCGGNGFLSAIVDSDIPLVTMSIETRYPFSGASIFMDKTNYEGFNLTALP